MRYRLALLLFFVFTSVQGQTLSIGLAEDPDILDPTLARTFVGRIVFSSLCDKLFDLDEKLNIVPMLATSYEWSADNKSLTLKLRQRRHLPRRREVRRRRGQVQPRAPQEHAGLQPARRALAGGERRRGGPADRAHQPKRAVRAAAGAAHRPRRHDGLAQGRRRGGRQVRRPSGVLRAVQVRRARGAGPHRARAFPGLLEQGRRSISTASPSCRSWTPRCASPTCAPGSSISSSASPAPMSPA